MSDMRLNMTSNAMMNDQKNRSPLDVVAAEMTNSHFLDVMLARIAGLHSDDAELQDLVRRVDRDKGADKADNKALLQRLQDVQQKQQVRASTGSDKVASATSREEVRQKVRERIRQIAENHTTPVEDRKPLELLQKTAAVLVEAGKDGTITLPRGILDKLQDFLAKGDDLRAFDMASFMTEFNELFRGVVIAMPADGAVAAGFEWPQEIVDAFAGTGLEALVAQEGPMDMMTVIRTLKALVNAGRQSAIDTLDAQAKIALDPQAAGSAGIEGEQTAQEDSDILASLPAGDNKPLPDSGKSAHVPVAATPSDSAMLAKESGKNLAGLMADNAATDPSPEQGMTGDENTGARDGQTRHGHDGKASDAQGRNAVQQALAQDIKAAFALHAQAQQAQSAATQNPALQNATADATLIGVDQGGISAPAAARAAFAAETAFATREKPAAATQQIMMQIQQKGPNKPAQIAVQLTPAELGRVEVRLTIRNDGQTHAVVMADKPETLALLQKDAGHLERALQQAGLDTQNGSMSFNLREEQRQDQHAASGRKRFNRNALEGVTGKEAALSLEPEAVISETRINYHA